MAINECPFDRDARYANICLALHRINVVGACGSMLSIADDDDRGELGAIRFRNMLSTAGDILEADIEHGWPESKRNYHFTPDIEAASRVAGMPDSWSWGAAHHFLSCQLYKNVIVYSLNKGTLGAPLRGPTDGLIKSLNYIKSSWQGFLHSGSRSDSIDPYMFMGVLHSYIPDTGFPDTGFDYKWRGQEKFVIGSLPYLPVETNIFFNSDEKLTEEIRNSKEEE
jgi:hypothetical protein